MRIVLDTNVMMSGVFFGGVPGRILSAWSAGKLSIALSASILAEYREVGAELTAKYGGGGFEPFAALLVMRSDVVDAPEHLPEPVCADAADDKFLACALASGARVIVSVSAVGGAPESAALLGHDPLLPHQPDTLRYRVTSARPLRGVEAPR